MSGIDPAGDFGGLRIGGLQLALPMSALREVVPCGRLERLPARAEGLLGAIDLRGVLVPVLDLRPLIGLGPEAAPMVGASGMLFGLAGVLIGWAGRAARAAGESLVPVGQAVLWLVALNLGLWVVTAGQLAWSCHLGGALAGVSRDLGFLKPVAFAEDDVHCRPQPPRTARIAAGST